MPYISINNMDISLSKAEKEYHKQDSLMGPSVNGVHHKSVSSTKLGYECETTYLSGTDAMQLIQLLEGEGEHFQFEGVTAADQQWGSKGTGANSGSSWTRDTINQKFGSACIDIDGSASEYFRVDLNLADGSTGPTPDDYSIYFWRKESGGSYYHYVYSNKGGTATEYRDGVAGTYNITNTVTISTGAAGYVSLLGKSIADGTTNITCYYDSFGIVPFAMTSDLAEAYATKTTELTGAPALDVGGDLLGNKSGVAKVMLAEVTDIKLHNATINGTFSGTAHTVSFKLTEKTGRRS